MRVKCNIMDERKADLKKDLDWIPRVGRVIGQWGIHHRTSLGLGVERSKVSQGAGQRKIHTGRLQMIILASYSTIEYANC